MTFPRGLLWLDLETTSIDKQRCQVLEVGCIVTDYDLNPVAGYTEVIRLTKEGLEDLRKPGNNVAVDMHRTSGLLREVRESQFTLAQAEVQIVNMLRETDYQPGELVLAGSGVAQFDYQIIERQMPLLLSWLTYYQLDTGILRRGAKILSGGRTLVNPVPESFQDGVKKHRALPDVEAHLEEGRRYQAFFRQATPSS